MGELNLTAADEILTALRHANDGWVLTVWNNTENGEGPNYRVWKPLDGKYAERDPFFILSIPLNLVADEFVRHLQESSGVLAGFAFGVLVGILIGESKS